MGRFGEQEEVKENIQGVEMLIEKEELEALLFEGKFLHDEEYRSRNRLSDEILLHSEGKPDAVFMLLDTKFPSEPNNLLEYRIRNFARITKTYFQKIVNTIAKINRADDFVIQFRDKKAREFAENEIKEYGSLREWYFTNCIKALLSEPNGGILVLPEWDEASGRYEPYPNIVRTYRLIRKTDDYVIVMEDEHTHLYCDRRYVIRIQKVDGKGNEVRSTIARKRKVEYELEVLFEHELNEVPFITFGGLPYDLDRIDIYESFISGVVPFWNQALVEFSDKQAGIKQHVFPEKWRYTSNACKSCNGTGQIKFHDVWDSCSTCGGSGSGMPTGMFAEITIRPSTAIEDKPPIPPVGYIEKSFDAIRYLDEDIKSNIASGLASINMEFIMASPASQSGIAKEMDRAELNSFLFQIARHVVYNNLIPLYRITLKWLYHLEGSSFDDKFVMPNISIPTSYDMVMDSDYTKQLAQAKTAGVSSYIVRELEKNYIEKKFQNFTDQKNILLMINQLDPLPGRNVAEKRDMYQSGAITKRDFVLSCNIEQLVSQATYDRAWMPGFGLDKQLEILYEYTDKLILDIDDETTIRPEATEEGS
jgi:hypothetical protein